MSQSNEKKLEPVITEASAVYYVNEKSETIEITNESSAGDETQDDGAITHNDNKEDSEPQIRAGVTTSDVKIIKAEIGYPHPQNAPPNQYYAYGQTPYYMQQQQYVGGRPVYIQGGSTDRRQETGYGRQPGRYDEEMPDIIIIASFDEREIRHLFVRKVYTLLSLQLLFTFGFILLATMVDEIKFFMVKHWYLVFFSLFGAMVLFCILACCGEVRRTTPINYILLGLCTICFAYEFAFLSIFYRTQIVLLAIMLTMIACVCITLFAIQTSWDVTGCGMYLCIASGIVMGFGLTAMIISFFAFIPIIHLVYATLIGLLFSMYLVYDTQQIVGGRRIRLSPEEYIMGALQLYIDILYIFYCILQLLGCADS